MTDVWQVPGTPPHELLVKPPEGSSRFHVSLPGRASVDSTIRVPVRRYSRLPGLLSLNKKLPPVHLVHAHSELPALPEEPAKSSSASSATAEAIEARELPSLVQGELPKFAVPAPPPRPRNGAVRPARQHERLPGGSARGMRSRAIAHAGFAGRTGDVAPSRWSDMKVLYTELVEAINGISIPTLLHTLAQAQVRGAHGWPEYGVAMKRLHVLQSLHAELQEAASGIDIGAIERVLHDASVLKVGPNVAGDKNWAVRGSAENRLTALRRVQGELNAATRGTSIPVLSVVLRSVQEVGVAHWDLTTQAECRLRFLSSLCARLYEAVNGSSCEALRDAISSAELFEVTDETDAPLGLAMIAARKRLITLEAEGEGSRDLSVFNCIDTQLSAAADTSDVGALRAAVVEAEIAFADGHVKVADKAAWQSLIRARDRLTALSLLEVEFVALQSTTVTDNLVAAIARADTLGCSTWELCKEAEDRLDKVRIIEAEMLQAVSENSVELLEQAVMHASSAGLSSWPHARAARKLLVKLDSTGEEVQGQVMKQFLSDLSNRLMRSNVPMHEPQNLLHAGLLVRMGEGSSQSEDPSLRAGIELAMRAALHLDVDVERVFHIEPSALVVELLMCPQQADPAEAVYDLQAQLEMDDSASMLKNCIFGESVTHRPQLLHVQVVDKFAARALKRHAGTALGSVASSNSRCSTVSGPPGSADSFNVEELSYETSRQLMDNLYSESSLGHYVDKEWSESGSCASRSFTPSAADLFETCMDGACAAAAASEEAEDARLKALAVVETGSVSGSSAPVVADNTTSRSLSSVQLAGCTVEELLNRAVSTHSCLPDYMHDPQGRQHFEAVCVTSELLASALNYLAREASPVADTRSAVSSITKTLQDIRYEDILSQTPGAWAHAATIESVARDAMHEAFDALMREDALERMDASTPASLIPPTMSPSPWRDRIAEDAAHNLVQKLFQPLGETPEVESIASLQGRAKSNSNSALSFVSFQSLEELAFEAVNNAFGCFFQEVQPDDESYLLEVQSVATSTARERIAHDATAHMVRVLFSHTATRLAEYEMSEASLSHVVGEDVARSLILDVSEGCMGPAKSNSILDEEPGSSCADAEVAVEAVQQVLDAYYQPSPGTPCSGMNVSVVTASEESDALSSFLGDEIANVTVNRILNASETPTSGQSISFVAASEDAATLSSFLGNEIANVAVNSYRLLETPSDRAVSRALDATPGTIKSSESYDVSGGSEEAALQTAMRLVHQHLTGPPRKESDDVSRGSDEMGLDVALQLVHRHLMSPGPKEASDVSGGSDEMGLNMALQLVHRHLASPGPKEASDLSLGTDEVGPHVADRLIQGLLKGPMPREAPSGQDAPPQVAASTGELPSVTTWKNPLPHRRQRPGGIETQQLGSVEVCPERGAAGDASDVVLSGVMSCDGLSPVAEKTINQMMTRALDATSAVSDATEQIQEEKKVSIVVQEALSASMAEQLALADGRQQLQRDVSMSRLSGTSSYGAGSLGRALVNDASIAALGQTAPTEISDVAYSAVTDQAEARGIVVNAAEEAISQFARSAASPITVAGFSNAPLAEFILARAVAIYTVRAVVQRARGIETSIHDLAEHYRSQDELMTALWSFAEEYISHASGSTDSADPLLAGGVVCDVLAGAVGHLAWRRVSEAALADMIGAPAARSQVSEILGRRQQSSRSEVSSWAADATRGIQRMSPASAANDTAVGRDVAKYALDTATRSCAQSSITKILSASGSYAASGVGAASVTLNSEAEELRLTASRLEKRDGPREVHRTLPGNALPSDSFYSSNDADRGIDR